MDKVGIRELKQNASAVIRRVKAGDTVEVTERGQPVARIIPISGEGPLQRMIAEGRATAADHDLLNFEPLSPTPGQRPLSEVLEEMRADER